jgi:hypothetical protein
LLLLLLQGLHAKRVTIGIQDHLDQLGGHLVGVRMESRESQESFHLKAEVVIVVELHLMQLQVEMISESANQ